MLDSIKTIYFFQKIFSYIDDKTKLNIVKYCKNLQNKININLINYKVFSGRYIIYEANGKGKERNIIVIMTNQYLKENI